MAEVAVDGAAAYAEEGGGGGLVAVGVGEGALDDVARRPEVIAAYLGSPA